MTLRTEEISKHHNRRNFDCGEPALNEFLQNIARQSSDKRLTRTFVLVDDERDPYVILGFYTLVPSTITFPQGHPLEKKYRPESPVYRMARLAVDRHYQGRNLGAFLLIEALERIIAASRSVGGIGCAVDAKNEKARAFYQQFGFEQMCTESGDPLALWLPYQECEDVVALVLAGGDG